MNNDMILPQIPSLKKRKTVVINAFGGAGAGKSTACLDIVAELKKRGYVAEYVQEYAKELVWDKNWELLNGSKKNQFTILKEQLKRVDRLYGNVDFVVTDAPILLNAVYNKELTPEYEKMLLNRYNSYNNFNFLVKRDPSKFEVEGRMQNLEESIVIDKEVASMLEKNNLYYGTYTHSTVQKIIDNSIKTFERVNHFPEKSPKRLFVDMDGTLAEFKNVNNMETLFEKGYFLNLKPIQSVVDAVKHFMIKYPDVEVKILSAVLDSKYAESEKNAWLDQHLPEIKKADRIFTRYGEDKTSYIEGGVKPNDFLLDDYTKNLNTWKMFSGQGIKLLNGINNTNNTWEGNRIRFNKLPEEISNNLNKIINKEEKIIDKTIVFKQTQNKGESFMNESRIKDLTEQTKVVICQSESLDLNEGQVLNIREANDLFTKLHQKQSELRKENKGVNFQFPSDDTKYVPFLKTKFQLIFPDGIKGAAQFDLGFSKYNDLYDCIKSSMDIDVKDYIHKLSQRPSDEITYNSKPIVTSQYMLNFPAIKHIKENTAKIIERFNEGRDIPLTVKEIRQRYKDLGKQLENNQCTKEDLQEFKDLQNVVDDFKNVQLKEKNNQIKKDLPEETKIHAPSID